MHTERISQSRHMHQSKRDATTHFADGEDVVNVQTLEQRPHREVHVDETATEVEPTREARDDLQARLRGRARGRSRGVEADKLTRARRGVREDLADLQGVRLHVLGEARPREGQVVAHEIVDGEPGDEGCKVIALSNLEVEQSL